MYFINIHVHFLEQDGGTFDCLSNGIPTELYRDYRWHLLPTVPYVQPNSVLLEVNMRMHLEAGLIVVFVYFLRARLGLFTGPVCCSHRSAG